MLAQIDAGRCSCSSSSPSLVVGSGSAVQNPNSSRHLTQALHHQYSSASLTCLSLSQPLCTLEQKEAWRRGGTLPNRVLHLPYFTHLITYPIETHIHVHVSTGETKREAPGGVKAFREFSRDWFDCDAV